MGYIYKITNTITGGIYIGQTVQTLEERLKQHFIISSKCKKRPLYQDIIKFGKENFKIECVVSVDTTSQLNELEIFYIKYYDSLREKNQNNYNLSKGGGFNQIRKNTNIQHPLIKLNENNWTVKIYENKKAILKEYTSDQLLRIYEVIDNGSNYAFGFYWKEMIIQKKHI